jgi:hypothetical protein
MRLLAAKAWLLGLCALALGCAPQPAAGRIRPDRSILTEDQFADKGYNNVYEVVQALRSNWLNARGPDSFASPTVVQAYFDGNRIGGIETLRTMEVRSVVYIRYFDGISATARWGLGHGAGVVYVSTHPLDGTPGATPP